MNEQQIRTVPEEPERAEFSRMQDEYRANCGHNPSAFDTWLMARGLQDTMGRVKIRPVTPLDRFEHDALRDTVAIDVLPEMIKILAAEGNLTRDGAAESAYGFADAMVRARRK